MSSFRGCMRKWLAMLIAAARGLIAHALPILIAQLSSIGMMVVDTAVLGHVGATDLAAVAIGGGIHISVVFALVGVLQAVAPVVANLHGAGRDGTMRGCLHPPTDPTHARWRHPWHRKDRTSPAGR